MNKIKDLFYKIVFHYRLLGRDKLVHFYTGAIGFVLFSLFLSDIIASIVMVSIAIVKEVFDSFDEDRHTEFLDAFMSSLPVILFWIVKLL